MSMTDDIEELKRRYHELREIQASLSKRIDEAGISVQDQIKAVYERLNELTRPDAKPWWASTTILGGAAAALATAAQVAGYVLGWPPEALAALASVSGGGGLMAIRGRINATTSIK